MDTLLFGIVIGMFLFFSGQRFFVWLVKTLKERKVNELKRMEEMLQEMIDKKKGK